MNLHHASLYTWYVTYYDIPILKITITPKLTFYRICFCRYATIISLTHICIVVYYSKYKNNRCTSLTISHNSVTIFSQTIMKVGTVCRKRGITMEFFSIDYHIQKEIQHSNLSSRLPLSILRSCLSSLFIMTPFGRDTILPTLFTYNVYIYNLSNGM